MQRGTDSHELQTFFCGFAPSLLCVKAVFNAITIQGEQDEAFDLC